MKVGVWHQQAFTITTISMVEAQISSIPTRWAILMMALALSAVTMFSLTKIDRFFVANQQLLSNTAFEGANKVWKRSGEGEIRFSENLATLTNQTVQNQTYYQTFDVDAPGYFRVSLIAAVEEVLPGKFHWEKASVSVYLLDSEGNRFDTIPILEAEGTIAMSEYSQRIYLGKNVEQATIDVRLLNTSGAISVGKIVISSLDEYLTYKTARNILSVVWAVYFSVLVFYLLRNTDGAMLKLCVLFGMLSVLGAIAPAFFVEIFKEIVSTILNTLAIGSLIGDLMIVSHFSIFLCVGVIAGWLYRKAGFIFVISAVLVFAVVTESVQVLVRTRTPSVDDLLVDSAGGLIGILIGICAMTISRLLR